MNVLIEVAQDDDEDDVSRAAGAALARLLIELGRLDDAPLHTFTGPAYLGFDDAVAAYQRLTGMTVDESTSATTTP